MSRTKKGSPKLGSIPKSFKKIQNKSQKMRLKENTKDALSNPDASDNLRIRKTHAWNNF